MLMYVDVVNKDCDGGRECRIINSEYIVQIRSFREACNEAHQVDEKTCFLHLHDSCENHSILRVYGSLKELANYISRGQEGLTPDAGIGSQSGIHKDNKIKESRLGEK